VTAKDALFVLWFNVRLTAALPCPDNADVNVDGEIDSLDARLILEYAVRIVDALPVPRTS
jgi:hypothetical protein